MCRVAVLCACRRRYNRNIIMSERLNNLLRNDNLVTGFAVTTLCKTVLGAGRLNRRINHLIVTLGRNNRTLFNGAALCAFKIRFLSILGTGRSLVCAVHRDCIAVSRCFNDIVNIAVTAGTGMGGVSVLFASRSGNNRRIGMAGSRNNLLLFYNGTADRANLASGQAVLRTGRSFSGNGFFGMAVCLNDLLSDDDLTANRALLALGQAVFRTCGLFSGDNLLLVSRCRNTYRGAYDRAADRAFFFGRIAAVKTVGSLCRNRNNRIMLFCDDRNIAVNLGQCIFIAAYGNLSVCGKRNARLFGCENERNGCVLCVGNINVYAVLNAARNDSKAVSRNCSLIPAVSVQRAVCADSKAVVSAVSCDRAPDGNAGDGFKRGVRAGDLFKVCRAVNIRNIHALTLDNGIAAVCDGFG